jgi:hypothetical protein
MAKNAFDEEGVLREMAKELGYDEDDLDITETTLFDTTVFEVKSGSKEWQVVEDHDAMHELAVASVKQDLEEEPGMFEPSFIESHIDEKKLRDELESDLQDMNYDDFNDMDDDELIKELQRSSLVEDPYLGEDDDEELVLEDREGLIEALAEEKTRRDLKYPLDYLEEIYGKEDAVKKAIEIAGIDEDAAAEEAVSSDGPEHYLSSYDGRSSETPSGFYYWRTN